MTLRLEEHWLWDFWLAQDGPDYHLFFLKAPRSLSDPELRHANAVVGHAVSDDLCDWEMLPDALGPGRPGAWDDRAIWTGSVVRANGDWLMLYTGTSVAEQGRIQRIGLATSADLTEWDRAGDSPVIEADGRWYERLGDSSWHEEAWRDPWMMREDGRFHALVTARSSNGPVDGRGVIGHAVSDDAHTWEVLPPLSRPGEFAHLEVPQVANVRGDHFLVFFCEHRGMSSVRRRRPDAEGDDATYMVASEGPLGPFDIASAQRSLPAHLCSGRLVRSPIGDWVWLAFIHRDENGAFVGELADPIPAGIG